LGTWVRAARFANVFGEGVTEWAGDGCAQLYSVVYWVKFAASNAELEAAASTNCRAQFGQDPRRNWRWLT